VTPAEHLAAVETGLKRIRRFEPDFLVVAAGFDTAKGDPTGTCSNAAADFETLGARIGAEGLPSLIVQEGGYRIRTLGANVRRFFIGLHKASAEARLKKRKPVSVASGKAPALSWRQTVRPGDAQAVRSLVAATGFFSAAEEAIAEELVGERIARGPKSGYHFLFAERGSSLDGYACFGPIDGTEAGFDLFWIAVHPDRQRSGLGRDILIRTEALMRAQGARIVWVDTAGKPAYAPTRAFYERAGYRKAAELTDFYGPGDTKIIYEKELQP
jgi:GNAT superfamily N-acetyltransferase